MQPFTDENRKDLEERIVEMMLAGLDKDEISEEDLPDISDYVLSKIDYVQNHEQLMNFLRELSSKWKVFSPILVIESGEAREKKENAVGQEVLNLAKSGKIEEALNLAKTVTGGTN